MPGFLPSHWERRRQEIYNTSSDIRNTSSYVPLKSDKVMLEDRMVEYNKLNWFKKIFTSKPKL